MKNKFEKAESINCIKEKAKELWKKDGCKQGRDLNYWLQAERIVKSFRCENRQILLVDVTLKGGDID